MIARRQLQLRLFTEGVLMTDRSRLEVAIDDEDGRPLAAADIDLADPLVARAALHVEAGCVPSGIRTRLVDAVLDTPRSLRASTCR